MMILISLITVQISSSGRNNSGIQGYSSLPSTNTPGTECVCVWEAKLQARTEASMCGRKRERGKAKGCNFSQQCQKDFNSGSTS